MDAEYFAFYKGVPYIKADLGNGGAFSFIIVIFDDSYTENNGGIDTVKHEYGHRVHLNQIGVVDYAAKVALPSLICAGLTNSGKIQHKYYHSIPTEYIADWLGKANHKNATNWETLAGFAYWLWTIISP